MRFQVEYYWLRNGVLQSAGHGIAGESTMDIAKVHQYDDIWEWVRGTYHHQIFNSNSTLRGFYEPVGVLRVRQQKAGVMDDCRRKEVPLEIRGSTCHYVYSHEETQDTVMLIIPSNLQWIDTSLSTEDSGRFADPDPLYWKPSQDFDAYLTGYLQSSYDGSGYQVDYNMSAPNVAETFLNDMEVFRSNWLNTNSRLLTFEVMLANYNLGGFVSSTFMFEISPSGSIQHTMHLLPMNLGEDVGGGGGALTLDVFRGILVFYILIVQVVNEVHFKASIGGSGLQYITSFTGFIDASTIAIYIAMVYMRLKHGPPNPREMVQFYSYSFEAVVHERLFTTESIFILLVLIRLCSFFKLSRHIDQYWKMVHRSTVVFGFWMFIFAPLFAGTVVFAHTVWSAHVDHFSTWWQTIVSLVFFIKQDFNLDVLYDANTTWTIPFVVYYHILMNLFMINGFLAIIVYAYFQVKLMDTNPKDPKPWTFDQWMDWILPGLIYKIIFKRPPGASKRIEDEGGEEGEDDEDSGDDDEEGKGD